MALEIPTFKLVAKPANTEAQLVKPFRYASPEIGRRHQLGGKPTWLQAPEFPRCAQGHDMSFYGQLDSVNDDYVLGDCGIIYVFVCFDCLETKSVLQSG